ncbi:ABC transporter ATP-binding protein [Reinekea marinisedimentorum]|uniref:Simple sugar transport system ATP-binding protein n=1 Tax=Reinekea marinisedimentorum TaxID=230495 RepID=A0A4R3I905_9GAMM|nr:ABC transporter ATP-binding protein [Reinekea marinisedimentorum]TCS42358.1 simple sugar transport system ATP-binding protein [Reinekea marinisedimentorum]
MITDSSPLRLSLRGITKRYPGCVANNKIDLDIHAGDIHALLGENGAGKSTLMKVIYGLVKPDEGDVLWEGEPVAIKDPAFARQMGIGMVFQHFSLFDTLTVTENIALALGKEAGDLPSLAKKIKAVSEKYGMTIQPDRLVHSLSVGERQRVEIVRCLVQDIKLLILDEPTSVLTPQEVDTLFETLRQLASEGCSILFISHKLQEVKALCHRATVLRAGEVSGHCLTENEDAASLARMMVGADTPITATFAKQFGTEPVLQVKQLSIPSESHFGMSLKDINLTVNAGEIVGIAGVAGNGQEELLASLSGETLSPPGTLFFKGQDVAQRRPNHRRALGLGFVPEERLGRGAIPDMSLTENSLLTGFLMNLLRKGFVHWNRTRNFTDRINNEFQVKTAGREATANSLSGGNLQKFIIGREILQQPDILVAAHPTWGVDIGAATAIHKALIALRNQGAAILVVSEDIDELFLIADRIGAICDGRISPLTPTEHASIEIVGRQMAGDFQAAS